MQANCMSGSMRRGEKRVMVHSANGHRYSGASMGYQLASLIARGPAPLIATALLAHYASGYAIAGFIFLCAAISVVSTAMLEDRTNQEISREYLTV